jgi:CRP-like cAMP-binding protein
MLTPSNSPETNQLIDRLPASSARSIIGHCHPVDLAFGQTVAEAGKLITQILFPTTAIISVTARLKGHKHLELGMIGHEGMFGASLKLAVDLHPMSAVVQGAGIALAMPAAAFSRQLERNASLRRLVDRYLFVIAEQLAQTAACNAFHDVPSRLARWLLMMDDRARGQPLELTHLFLAQMLGVRRSAVTIAAGHFQALQLIRYARGHIQLLSRQGLESVACECYSASLDAYQRQFATEEG